MKPLTRFRDLSESNTEKRLPRCSFQEPFDLVTRQEFRGRSETITPPCDGKIRLKRYERNDPIHSRVARHIKACPRSTVPMSCNMPSSPRSKKPEASQAGKRVLTYRGTIEKKPKICALIDKIEESTERSTLFSSMPHGRMGDFLRSLWATSHLPNEATAQHILQFGKTPTAFSEWLAPLLHQLQGRFYAKNWSAKFGDGTTGLVGSRVDYITALLSSMLDCDVRGEKLKNSRLPIALKGEEKPTLLEGARLAVGILHSTATGEPLSLGLHLLKEEPSEFVQTVGDTFPQGSCQGWNHIVNHLQRNCCEMINSSYHSKMDMPRLILAGTLGSLKGLNTSKDPNADAQSWISAVLTDLKINAPTSPQHLTWNGDLTSAQAYIDMVYAPL